MHKLANKGKLASGECCLAGVRLSFVHILASTNYILDIGSIGGIIVMEAFIAYENQLG